ncbi:alpha/beta hydrolase family protein [Microbacteriaceae bacterium 4G12]
MRLLETTLLIVNIMIIGWMIIRLDKKLRILIGVSCISTAILFVHLFFEGPRWQMIPTYLITIFIWMYCMKRYSVSEKKITVSKRRKVLRIVIGIVYVLIAVILPICLPVFSFERSTGPYEIGTVTYHWVDENRGETYTNDPKDRRKLLVQIWYPAKKEKNSSRATYISNSLNYSNELAKEFHLPQFILSYLDLVKTHSVSGAQLSDKEPNYPVLLFSPSNGGTRFQNTFQVEELASHGYIVVGIEHPYHSIVTVFPDGHVTGFHKLNLLDSSVVDHAVEQVIVKDSQFVLDQLSKLNQDDPSNRFKGKLNLDRVGMIGHSLGGAATVQMLFHDERIKAGINMDGTFFGDQIPDTGLKKPFMLMNSAASVTSETEKPEASQLTKYGLTREKFDQIIRENAQRKTNALANGGYSLTIKNTKHYSYSDFYLYSPLLQWMDGINPRPVHRMINNFTVAFFDQYLKDKNSLLDDYIKKYPEVSLERY